VTNDVYSVDVVLYMYLSKYVLLSPIEKLEFVCRRL